MLQHIGLYVTVQYVVCSGYTLCDSVLHTYIHMQVVTMIAVAQCSIIIYSTTTLVHLWC